MRQLLICFSTILLFIVAPIWTGVHAQDKFHKGRLLVAKPDMPDPRFIETVIFICRHDPSGAFGLVLNRPAGRIELSKLLDSIGENSVGIKGSVQIRLGGPVEMEMGFLMYADELIKDEPICNSHGVAVTSSEKVMKSLGSAGGPEKSVLFFGYTGWGPGQLESELARKDWLIVSANRSILFDNNLKGLWKRARNKHGINL